MSGDPVLDAIEDGLQVGSAISAAAIHIIARDGFGPEGGLEFMTPGKLHSRISAIVDALMHGDDPSGICHSNRRSVTSSKTGCEGCVSHCGRCPVCATGDECGRVHCEIRDDCRHDRHDGRGFCLGHSDAYERWGDLLRQAGPYRELYAKITEHNIEVARNG